MKETKIKKIYRNINLNEWELLEIKEIKAQNNSNTERIANIEAKLDKVFRNSNELVFANVFHDTIKNSEWFKNVPLSLSGWAIGYNFAYILYRILDDIRPKSILELGLGQSTKIINEYAKYYKNTEHHIAEHNKDWIEFFKKKVDMSEMANFHFLENYKRNYEGNEVNAYKGFEKEFKKKKFDLIVIDGPVGGTQEYSRLDTLDIIPGCLNKSFAIILDDCERIGEQRMISLLEKKLNDNNVEFISAYNFVGKTDVYICVSKDLAFLCTI